MPGQRRFAPLAATLAAATALAGLAGCGGPAGSGSKRAAPTTTAPPAGGARLTETQAVQLASALYDDYQAGGAQVMVTLDYQTGTQVGIEGDIDFQHHQGHLQVTTVVAGSGTSVEDVDYTQTMVYEQGGPDVAQELARSGRPGQSWVGRPPDPTSRPLDKVIEILVALASPSRDNPLLLQESAARYLGAATLDGTTVSVYAYNQAVDYFVGDRDGLIHRFVGTVAGFAGPVTIDLTSPGARTEAPPPAASVLVVSSLPTTGTTAP